MDYKKIGLKIGIEIHQRLATEKKLFCNCPSNFDETENQLFAFERKLRPTTSEIGEIDQAAMHEFVRRKDFVYSHYPNCCSVETDSDFPFELNKEALLIGLQLSKMLAMQVPDTIHIMRKVVIDGSNTAGYQRTALIATGYEKSIINTNFGGVRVKDLNLEEESATKIEESDSKTNYRLDRLGIPLVEISSYPDIWHPEQAKEFASKLGLLLRSLKVQRGIGTIRQDVNISVRGGARIEIKGFQELRLLDKLVETEAKRQLDLISVKKTINNIEIKFKEKELGEFFKKSSCQFLRKLSKEKIICLRVKDFQGIFKLQCGEITLGKEIANYAKFYGLKGIIHSDEDLEKYGFAKKEIVILKEKMNSKEKDLLIIIGGNKCELALGLIKTRILYLKKGVPEETRFAEGTNTRYARPLPGAARMYPETDSPFIKVSDLFEKISLPETLEDKSKKFQEIGLNKDLAEQITKSKELGLFEKLLSYKVEPKIIADLLVNKKKALEREGNKIEEEGIRFVLENLEKDRIVKKAIQEVLVRKDISGFEKIKGTELKKLVEKFKKKYKSQAMPELMKVYGKRIESKEVKSLL